jgi:hypothetical protein
LKKIAHFVKNYEYFVIKLSILENNRSCCKKLRILCEKVAYFLKKSFF